MEFKAEEEKQLLGDLALGLSHGMADSSQKDEDKTAWTTKQHADVDLGGSADMYEAVLVACFGGLKMDLGYGEFVRVHPIFPFLLSLPLFAIQVSLALFLLVSADFKDGIANCPEKEECTPRHESGMGLLKVVLILLVFISNFKLFEASVMHLLFILNPITWCEVQRFSARLITIVPCCIASTMTAFSMIYLVNTSSITVILQSREVDDAIFNSLAVQFICDLSEAWWGFCSSTFRFQPIDDFTFDLRDQKATWGNDGKLCEGHCIANCIVRLTTLPWTTSSFLRIGFGGARLRRVAAISTLAALLVHQLLITALAWGIHKNLPALPDMCAFYRMVETGQSGSFINNFCMFDIASELESKLPGLQGTLAEDIDCFKSFGVGFYNTSFEMEWGVLVNLYNAGLGGPMFLFFGFVFAVLVLPTILADILLACKRCKRHAGLETDSEGADDGASEMASVRKDMSDMRKLNEKQASMLSDAMSKMNMLEDEISKLKASSHGLFC